MSKRALRQAAGVAAVMFLLAGTPAVAEDPSESVTPTSPSPSASAAPSTPASPDTPTGPDSPDNPESQDNSAKPGAPEQPEPSKAAEQPAADAPKPDLKITVTVPDGEYVLAEEVPVAVTIENIGDADATAVTGEASASGGATASVGSYQWNEFAPGGGGGTIPAHTSVKLDLRAQLDEYKSGDVQLKLQVTTPDEANQADNAQVVTIKVVPPNRTSTVGGYIYADKNDNGGYDTGEGLADVKIGLGTSGGPDAPRFETKSGADGRFVFQDVPARLYRLEFPRSLPGDWVTAGQEVVRATGDDLGDKFRIRAVRPLRNSLKVSAKFNEGPYQPGDKASLTITLVNGGTKAVERVIAGCDRGGFPERHLGNWADPEYWGDLAYAQGKGTGVTVAPGETKTMQVSGIVPAGSIEHGVVYISCDFGPADQEYLDGYPGVFVLAKVPGKYGKSTGTFYHDKDDDSTVDEGEPVADLEVTLIDAVDGTELTKARTGPDGKIDFGIHPAGWYLPVFHGPWRLKEAEFVVISTDPNWSQGWAARIVPDDSGTPPRTPTQEPTPRTPGQTRALASTGANVAGLAIGGLALLLAGAGTVVFTRRRRKSV